MLSIVEKEFAKQSLFLQNQYHQQVQQMSNTTKELIDTFLRNLVKSVDTQIQQYLQLNQDKFICQRCKDKSQLVMLSLQDLLVNNNNDITKQMVDLNNNILSNYESTLNCERILEEFRKQNSLHQKQNLDKDQAHILARLENRMNRMTSLSEQQQEKLNADILHINRTLLQLNNKLQIVSAPPQDQPNGDSQPAISLSISQEQTEVDVKEAPRSRQKKQRKEQKPELSRDDQIVAQQDNIVFVTNTGKKYHRQHCKFLRSRNPIDIDEIKAKGFQECLVCF